MSITNYATICLSLCMCMGWSTSHCLEKAKETIQLPSIPKPTTWFASACSWWSRQHFLNLVSPCQSVTDNPPTLDNWHIRHLTYCQFGKWLSQRRVPHTVYFLTSDFRVCLRLIDVCTIFHGKSIMVIWIYEILVVKLYNLNIYYSWSSLTALVWVVGPWFYKQTKMQWSIQLVSISSQIPLFTSRRLGTWYVYRYPAAANYTWRKQIWRRKEREEPCLSLKPMAACLVEKMPQVCDEIVRQRKPRTK